MNRVVLASVAVAAVAGAAVLGWFEVRQTREFRRLMAVGDAALANHQTSAAIEAYSGAIALRRDSMLGWLKRGDTYRRRGELSPALRDLKQAAALDPTAPRPIELLGDVYTALGHYPEAIDLYTRYVGLDDRAPRILYKRALAQYRADRIAPAIDSVRKALALDRQMTEGYYLLGLCEHDAGRAPQAAAAFARAVSQDPTFAPAREALAAVDAAIGRRRDSIEQLEALAALDPGRADHLVDIAQAFARAGRFEAAVATLGRAADRYPDATSVYLALARVWLDAAEDPQDRVAAAKAAQALQSVRDRDSSEFLLLRGRAQLLSGDSAGAERSLQGATTTLPVDPAAFRYLSAAAERLGHRQAAQRARARYAALAP